jgi:flagellar basal-body rod protein FlgB
MTNLLTTLKNHMQYTSARHNVLSDNMARVNMPGEKAFDLKPINPSSAGSSHSIKLAVTSAGHIIPKSTGAGYSLTKMETSEETMSGNNIVPEDQILKIAENSTSHTQAILLYKQISNMFKTAINSER